MNCIVCKCLLGRLGWGYFWADEKTGKGLCLSCGKCAKCGNSFSPQGYMHHNEKNPELRCTLTPGICSDCYDADWKSKLATRKDNNSKVL